MLYEQTLEAGKKLTLQLRGKYFLLESCGSAGVVDVTLMRAGSEFFRSPGSSRGLRLGVEHHFDGLALMAEEDTIVRWYVTAEPISISTTDGAAVEIKNSPAKAVPVSIVSPDPLPVIHTGEVNVTADNVKLSLAGSVVNSEPVAVTDAAAVMLAAGAARRGFRVKNAGASPVAIGGPGIVFSEAVVVLEPGDVFVESDAPGAEWYAVCGAGLVSALNIQVLS